MPSGADIRHLASSLRLIGACTCALFVVLVLIVSDPGTAAPIVVTANVVSSTTVTDNCTSAQALNLGTAFPGTAMVGATDATNVCKIGFSASGATSTLRISQTDGVGAAMNDDQPNWQSVRWQDRPYNDVAMAPSTPTTAFAIDGWGGFAKTIDGGSSWAQFGPGVPVSGECLAIDAVSATDVWVSCQGGNIAHSINGGSSWTVFGPAQTGTTSDLFTIGAPTSSTVYAGGQTGTLVVTVNTGGTWASRKTTPGSLSVAALDAASAAVAYVVADDKVYRTANTGASWTELTGSSGTENCWSIDAASTTIAWIACERGRVLRASATTMTDANMPDQQLETFDITSTDANHAWAVRHDGTIAVTVDGGANWTLNTTTTANALTGIRVDPTGNRLYVVGRGAVILGSVDKGVTWAYQDAHTPTMLDVSMATANIAWTVGGDGAIEKTTDGGTNWTPQTSGITTPLRGVVAISTQAAVAVGDNGVVVRTANGGTLWSQISVSGVTESLRQITALDSNNLLAIGTHGRVIRSADAGLTWASVRNSTNSDTALNGVVWSTAASAWIVGDDNLIEQSTDGGSTWGAKTGPTSNEQLLSVAVSNDAQHIIIGGKYDQIWESRNGGATPFTLMPGGSGHGRFRHLDWIGSGFFFGGEVGVSRSIDDGATMASDSSDGGVLYGFDMLDTNRGIAVSDGGTVRITTPGASIDDFGAGHDWAPGVKTALFGICLQKLTGTNVAGDWSPESGNGTCETIPTDPWHAVPAASANVAHTTAAGASGEAQFVFGFRPGQSTPAGVYRATIRMEVVSP